MGRKRRKHQAQDGFGPSGLGEDEDDLDDLDDDEGFGDHSGFGQDPLDAGETALSAEPEVPVDTGPGSADPDLKVVRVDKWLWAARLYKTRSIASEACSENQVKVNDMSTKSSKMVRPGDVVVAITSGGKRQYRVVGLAETRGSAKAAATLFVDETPEEWKAPKRPWDKGSSDYRGGIIQDKKARKRDRRAARKMKRR